MQHTINNIQQKESLDWWIIVPVMLLIGLGLLIMTSASMPIAAQKGHHPFYFLYHQIAHLGLGMIILIICYKIPFTTLEKYTFPFLLFFFLLMLMTMTPGISHKINGSARWLYIGPLHIQISEFAKPITLIYISNYLNKCAFQITKIGDFIKPLLPVTLIAFCLILQPDFGTAMLILMMTFIMLFLAGTPWRYLVGIGVLALLLLACLTYMSPYRMQRITAFHHPWHDPYGHGYQLTQALIAFGRGGLWGTGLGNSIQKLFYLPEAHTDFIFAICAEEFGFIGCLIIILLYTLLILRAVLISIRLIKMKMIYPASIALGSSLWLYLQVSINIAVNIGLLPTKGFTLPWISYGGSSLIAQMILIGWLLRASAMAQSWGKN